MDLLEYQGKRLLASRGIEIPPGQVAETPEQARDAAQAIGGRVVVKAQVQIGGRGKAGGIKVAENPDEAFEHATAILGMDIKGHTVRSVWVEAASAIKKEYYASVTFDRAERSFAAMRCRGYRGALTGVTPGELQTKDWWALVIGLAVLVVLYGIR